MKRLTWLLLLLFLLGCAPPLPFAGVKNLYEARGTTIICFGNSITAGEGTSAGRDYPTLLGQKVKLPVINLGRNGDTTTSALLRVEEIVKHNPRIVLVELGGNDFLRHTPSARTFNNLREIVDKIQKQKAVVVLISMPLGPDYESNYKKLAKEKGAVLVENVMREIFADRNLLADELHPNHKGYQKMAEEIGRVINELLTEMNP